MANVNDFLKADLKRMGADGLYSPEAGCGCLREDLAPCGSLRKTCVAAWNNPRRAKEYGVDFWMVPFSAPPPSDAQESALNEPSGISGQLPAQEAESVPVARRPTEAEARSAIEAWLNKQAPGYPCYGLCEDGEVCWAFWVAEKDTTSYVHADLSIEWYGTGWPDLYDVDEDSGMWRDRADLASPGAQGGG